MDLTEFSLLGFFFIVAIKAINIFINIIKLQDEEYILIKKANLAYLTMHKSIRYKSSATGINKKRLPSTINNIKNSEHIHNYRNNSRLYIKDGKAA